MRHDAPTPSPTPERPVTAPRLGKESLLYIGSGLIAFVFAAFQYLIGNRTGSEAVEADALHLFTDGLHSVMSLAIVLMVLWSAAPARRVREIGGYGQGGFMLLAATLTVVNTVMFGIEPTRSYGTGIIVSVAGTGVAWIRFRILHKGSPWQALREAVAHLRTESGAFNPTYLNELIHVITDMGVSAVAALSLFAGWHGLPYTDETFLVFVTFWFISCGTIMIRLSAKHGAQPCAHDHAH